MTDMEQEKNSRSVGGGVESPKSKLRESGRTYADSSGNEMNGWTRSYEGRLNTGGKPSQSAACASHSLPDEHLPNTEAPIVYI